jgi:hypothetical protein
MTGGGETTDSVEFSTPFVTDPMTRMRRMLRIGAGPGCMRTYRMKHQDFQHPFAAT